MPKFLILHKQNGIELWSGQADSAQDALIRMEKELGPLPVSVFDSTASEPKWIDFDSYVDANQIFVPEAIADFETTA